MINTKGILAAAILVLAFLGGCIQQKFEEPPENTIPEGTILTIAEVRQMYIDSIILGPYSTYKFTDDYSLYATVTMDDKSGNIYKSAYIQDATGAINLHLQASGGLYEGDSIRLYLKELILDDYENMLQLDSVDVDLHTIKVGTDMHREPEVVTIPQIGTGNFQAKLIKIEDVQFVESDLGETFADAENLETMNRTIEDCNGNQIIVRTSGYASFADNILPEGKGSIVGVMGQFRDDWQLYVRSMHEVEMDGFRCGEYLALLEENFDEVGNGTPVSIEGWNNLSVQGTTQWLGLNNGYDTMARITGNGLAETWLITPAINLDATVGELLSFTTRALNLFQSELSVWISADYDGSSTPSSATWTELTDAQIASGSATTNSGNIDISSYSGNVHIAFRFHCQTGGSGQYYLDNVVVFVE